MAYSKVERHVWDDERFRLWTRDVRDTWLYLLTNKHQNRIGMFVMDPAYVAADVQISVEAAQAAIEFLAGTGRIMWDPDTRLLFMCRHLKHNPIENPNVAVATLRELFAQPFAEPLWKGLLEAVETYCKMKTDKGAPFCEPLATEIRKKLSQHELNRSGNGSGNGYPNPKGMGNPEPEPEPEPKEGNSVSNETGASAAVDNSKREPNGTADPADETVHQRFMPILREAGFNADNTDGSILKRLNEQGRRWIDIEAAIQGLAYGRDHGMLRESHGIEPDDPLSLKLLYAKNKTTNPPLWTDAIDTWYPAWLRSQDEIANGVRRKSEWGVRI